MGKPIDKSIIVVNHFLIDIDCVGQSIEIDGNNFFIVSAIDFNDIIAIMIFHYLRGSTPNQCIENWASFENLRTASDWRLLFPFSWRSCLSTLFCIFAG